MPAAAKARKRLEVVILGCGVPKFSMGWTHLFQTLQPPLSGMADVVGIVEPFFLSEAGRTAKGADLFRAWLSEHPSIPCVGSCEKLLPVAPGKLRVGILAVRTLDAKQMFFDAAGPGGCRAFYLEKPGAGSIGDMDEMRRLAEEKGLTVAVGYSRNLGYPRRALAFAEEQRAATGQAPSIRLVHSNPWKEEELATCFDRCRPGMMYDMACHDLAMAVSYLGLTADYESLDVDAGRSLQATYGGIDDFVRLAFTLHPKDAKPVNFWIDRCAGAFNGMEVEVVGKGGEVRRFMSGEQPFFENPLEDLSPTLAVQYDLYLEMKRALFEASRDERVSDFWSGFRPCRFCSLLLNRAASILQSCQWACRRLPWRAR